MEVRYISKIEGDKVTLTSLTRAVAEEEITVDITELTELRKNINIYGFNTITGNIKVLTKEDAENIYKSKLKLIGEEYSPKAKVEVTDIKNVKSTVCVDITIGQDVDHSRFPLSC